MMTYTILTEHSALDTTLSKVDPNHEMLRDEQTEWLVSNGYDRAEQLLSEACAGLDVKQGADLVRFESGQIGLVGYYNDIRSYAVLS